jgi:2-polyprenyl-3-methyl-5-hydroxy-6-metoxy-1,4-benzoquinol methylase
MSRDTSFTSMHTRGFDGFAQSAPNAVLISFAEEELKRAGGGRLLDVGCGAGRNALPLARLGWSRVPP